MTALRAPRSRRPSPPAGAAVRPIADVLDPASVLSRSGQENFPVAPWVLPRAVRQDLLAIYGFARLVDDLGDEAEGDRERHLDWLERELAAAMDGRAGHPILRGLGATIARGGIPAEPFHRLIAANRQDQRVTRHGTYEDLVAYCGLSANPVGELVLHVLGAATPDRLALSDAVCTGLQLTEHWQDVAEDHARGRVYVPQEDLARFGVAEEDLGRTAATAAARRLLAFEVARARELLDRGAPLAGMLPGRAGLAVAGFVGGGRAALDAIERGGFDVWGRRPRPSRGRRLRAILAAAAVAAPPVLPSRPARRGGRRAAPALSAYRACEEITRRRGRNFSYGIRLLPPAKRRALSAVYAFARRVDDVADGDVSAAEALLRIEEIRGSLDRTPPPEDAVMVALGDARRSFGLPVDALHDLLDGVAMDLRGTAYRTFEDLEGYCRRVAGSIGRLSVAVFGATDPPRASALADDLGVAMQLTNILRDVAQDLAAGRRYLPEEDLTAFGWEPERGADEAFSRLVRFEASRARGWFGRGLSLLPLLDGRSAACVSAMAGVYRRLLDRVERDPAAAFAHRVSVPPGQKAAVAARSLALAAVHRTRTGPP